MAQVHNFSFGSFEWFIGVVEDRDDPVKLGRLRVRAFGYHADSGSIPTTDLPWAMVVQNITSSAQKGVGQSPTGIQVGTHVIGFFADGKAAQTPIILGSLAGMPEGESDANKLARGEDLQDTVIEEKKASLVESRADSNALSGFPAVTNLQSQISQAVNSAKSALTGVKDQFAAVGDVSLMTSLNSISSLFTQIASMPANVEALKSQLEGQISSFKGRIDNLRNLDPEEYVRGLADIQTRDVEASIRALQNLDFDGAMATIQNIPMAIGQVERLTSSIQSMANMGNIVSTIKGLSSSIPNIGSITGLARTIVGGNVWNEPPTLAAPAYPLNKIMETEGGHIEEYDDTPGSERYHRYHPAGTFTETHPDGTQVDKIVKDNYRVILGDDYLHVEGTVKVNIVGNSTIVVNGDATTEVSGNRTEVVKGDYALAVGGNISIVSGGAIQESAGSQFAVKAARIDLN